MSASRTRPALGALAGALAAAAALVVPAAAPAQQTQPPAPGFVSRSTARYELHATSPTMLDTAQAQIDHARAQFTRYFGVEAPPIAVVVAPTREELARFDHEALKTRQPHSLFWTLQVGGGAPGTAGPARTQGPVQPKLRLPDGTERVVAQLGDLKVAVDSAPDGPGAAVLVSVPANDALGITLRQGDIIRGVNGILATSMQDVIDRYVAVPVGDTVAFDVERSGALVHVAFRKPPSQGGLGGGPGAMGRNRGGEPHVLAHEVCHVLFRAFVDQRLGPGAERKGLQPARAAGGASVAVYGHPLIPDWFDEVPAVLCEQPAGRQQHLAYLRQYAHAPIPLAEFFAASHPVVAGLREAAAQMQMRGEPTQHPTSVTTSGGPGPVSITTRVQPGTVRDGGLFYGQALSVAEFLAEREGPTFIARVAEGLMRGQSMDEILRGAKTLPKDVAGLDREWRAWLAKSTG